MEFKAKFDILCCSQNPWTGMGFGSTRPPATKMCFWLSAIVMNMTTFRSNVTYFVTDLFVLSRRCHITTQSK